jgi:hypothetical protein
MITHCQLSASRKQTYKSASVANHTVIITLTKALGYCWFYYLSLCLVRVYVNGQPVTAADGQRLPLNHFFINFVLAFVLVLCVKPGWVPRLHTGAPHTGHQHGRCGVVMRILAYYARGRGSIPAQCKHFCA